MDIITDAELASWLRNSDLAEDASLQQIVALTNELLTDGWADPVDPVPAQVKMLALSVGARAWVNNPAEGNVSSTSVSVDDASTTRRFREPARTGVFLTADEWALLNGEPRVRSVRLVVHGDT